MKSLRIATAVALAAASVFTASGAFASAKVKVDLPNAAVAASQSVTIPVVASGITWTQVDVNLTSVDGDLTVADPTSLLTLQPGYSSLTGTDLSFFGNTADVVEILKAGLTWVAPATPATTTLKFKLVLSEHLDGQVVNPGNGHTYRFVDNSINWLNSRSAAAALTFHGHTGYLATITDADENDFIANKTSAQDVWIGGSSNNAVLGALTPAITGNPSNTCNYYWAEGPDAGTQINSDCVTPASVAGSFMSYNEFEPNGASGSEDCLVDNVGGNLGYWNDLICTTTNVGGYLVEFDTVAADFSASDLVFDDLQGTALDSNPAAKLAFTGSFGELQAGMAALALAAGAAFVAAGRRKATN